MTEKTKTPIEDEEWSKKLMILQEENRKLRNRLTLIKAIADEGFI